MIHLGAQPESFASSELRTLAGCMPAAFSLPEAVPPGVIITENPLMAQDGASRMAQKHLVPEFPNAGQDGRVASDVVLQ